MCKRKTLFGLLTILAIMVVAVGCSSRSSDLFQSDRAQHERILLWHTWTGGQIAALNEMLATYQELHPDVEVLSIAVPPDTLVARMEDRSHAGLGPDLVLADADTVYTLAARGLLRTLPLETTTLPSYLSTALRMVADDTRLYALPLAAHTNVLYYNRSQVQTPPATVTELLERTENGETVAQDPGFFGSYWGIGAYDGGIFDSQGRLQLGRGGFTNWLDVLATARTLPGFLLDDDPAVLEQAFIAGEATYFIADSERFPDLVAAMGPDVVGVAALPNGPNGGAPRPLLYLDALAFSDVSSRAEFSEALNLARFLGGVQNQLFLATADLGLVPVNSDVRLTPSLPADTLTVARQARSATPIAFVDRPVWAQLVSGELGFVDSYRQVSRGVLAPATVVEQALTQLESTYGVLRSTIAPEDLCPAQPGRAVIWHALAVDEADVFNGLARIFEMTCPGVELSVVEVPGDEIAERFGEEARAGAGPDMLFESSRWLAPLAEEGLLLNLTELVAPEFLQQFVPNSVEAMRHRGRLYGIPESLLVLALYYNSTMVSDPPIDMQQLVVSSNVDTRIALPVGFYWGYWGMDPFGGFEFDSYRGEILDAQGLITWLESLQRVDVEPGVDYYFAFDEAEDVFAFEEAAYLVSGPWSLPRLRQELGADRFRVVPLPNGPFKPGSPMLQVRGAMLNANADTLAVDVALAFSQFLNLTTSQERFLETGDHVSASVTVDLSGYPNIVGFREQAKAAALVVENHNFVKLEELGNELYRAVLLDGADPAIAVPDFVDAVHAATGVTSAESSSE